MNSTILWSYVVLLLVQVFALTFKKELEQKRAEKLDKLNTNS